MTTLMRNVDIFSTAQAAALAGGKDLILSAVNQSRTHYDGRKIDWEKEYWAFGSMSAGTSAQMVDRWPEIQKWWAKRCRDTTYLEGVQIYGRVAENLTAGVAVIKDHYWQEYPRDKERIMHFAIKAYNAVKKLTDEYDKICIPLLGAGYGYTPINMMLELVEGMELPDNVFIFYQE